MKRSLSLLLGAAAIAGATVTAQPPAGYYAPAEGLSGPALRAALRDIIHGHLTLGYNALWTAFVTTDDRPDGKVWDMYSDVGFTFVTDQCGSGGPDGEGDCYNREHSFPKDWFGGEVPPMYTDLFHLYPTDGYVNEERSNLPFGEVGTATWTGGNGTKKGPCVYPGYSGTVFEPVDDYKGDFARTYLYMLTCYQTEAASWSSPMLQSGNFTTWARNMLVEWSDADPVSAKEIERNNTVYGFQHNRNPYIDRPEWVHAIWGPDAGIADPGLAAARIWADGEAVHVSAPLPISGSLRVLDLTGRTVLARSLQGTQADVPFAAPRGVYIAELLLPGERQVQRFMW